MRPCHIDRGDESIDIDYDAAGHEITRRDRFGSSKPKVWTFRYSGDRLVETTLDTNMTFGFEDDAAGRHIAGTSTYKAGKKHVDWRADYKDDRLVMQQELATVGFGSDARDVARQRTTYAYDRYGRVIRSVTSFEVSGTETSTYEYDDSMKCRRYRNPENLPGETVNEPCPTTITTDDNGRRRISRPTYRDGRLMQDNDYIYSYDSSGRLERMRTLHADNGAHDTLFTYSCNR